MLTGGCFCGEVRYAVDAQPSDSSLCHCETCRRTTGAPAVAWFGVRPSQFRFTAGAPKAFVSSEVGTRRFCGTCGAHVAFEDKRGPAIDVATATLDEAGAYPLVDNIWTVSRLPWMTSLDTLPDLPRGHRSELVAAPEGSA